MSLIYHHIGGKKPDGIVSISARFRSNNLKTTKKQLNTQKYAHSLLVLGTFTQVGSLGVQIFFLQHFFGIIYINEIFNNIINVIISIYVQR